MSAPPIVADDAPLALKTFAAHATHRATLWQIGDSGLWEAVCGLRETAWRHRLAADHGRLEVEWIIGTAFGELGVDYGDIRPLPEVYP
jgi:hypothetical protein